MTTLDEELELLLDEDQPSFRPTAVVPRVPAPEGRELAVGGRTLRAVRDRRAVGTALLSLAAGIAGLFVWLLLLSHLPASLAQHDLEGRFTRALGSRRAPIGAPITIGEPVAMIEVPRLGLRRVVVEGATPGQLTRAPGHVPGTALPGQSGAVVLVGRRTTSGAPFRRLVDVRNGDEIKVTTGQGLSTYIVSGRSTRSDAAPLSVSGDRLLMVSADPSFMPDRLLLVEARLTSPPYPGSATATPVRLDVLSGDAGAWVSLILRLQLLLLAVGAAVWLRLRWSRWAAHVVCVPLVGAALWSVYAQVTLVLPAAW